MAEDPTEPRDVFLGYPCLGAIELLECLRSGFALSPRIRVVYEVMFFSTAVVLWNIKTRVKAKRPDLFAAIEGGTRRAVEQVIRDIEEDKPAATVATIFTRRCSEYDGLISSSFSNPFRILTLRAYHPAARAFLGNAFGDKMCSSSLVSDVARWAVDCGVRLDRNAPPVPRSAQ